MNIGLIPKKWRRLTPNSEAVIDASTGQRISYADFDDFIRNSEWALDLGLEKGDRVAILSQNS